MNRSRVVFQLPGSSCPGNEEEPTIVESGSSHPSAVARTTTGGSSSEHSATPVNDSEKRNNQCAADPDRKTKNNSLSGCGSNSKKASAALLSLVAVEFLLDQQRSFLPSSRLQPFQVTHTHKIVYMYIQLAIRWPTCSLTPANIKIAQALFCVCLLFSLPIQQRT